MKRELLEEMNLEKEQIDTIMAANGKDIENAKGDLSSKETELADTKKLLEDANNEIEGFKDLDVEGIKQASEEYKSKYEQAQEDAKKELEGVKFEHELESAIRDSKAKNTKAVKALLDIETLRGSNNRNESIAEALGVVKSDNDYLFEGSEAVGTGGSLGNAGRNKSNKTISKEEFKDMGYLEKLKLKQKDAELYQELANKGE